MMKPALDPFALLGLPRRFELDHAALQRAWLERAAKLHPDRADAPDDAARLSADLNEAKAVLQDPERRANALVSLLGGPTKEMDKSLPEGFLMEMLEVREAMQAEIEAEGEDARARWESWAASRRGEIISRVGELFARGCDAATLRAVRTELNAWRYIERMIEQV